MFKGVRSTSKYMTSDNRESEREQNKETKRYITCSNKKKGRKDYLKSKKKKRGRETRFLETTSVNVQDVMKEDVVKRQNALRCSPTSIRRRQ